MRPTLDERRNAADAAWHGLFEAWGRLDRARLGRRDIMRSWWWRLWHGRSWARHVAARRAIVREELAAYREAVAARDAEHAWMVLNQNADRKLANWIRARRGQAAWTPHRPPPSPTEAAWASYMKKDGERPIPREKPRPAEREHAPGAPSAGAVVLPGKLLRVTRDADGTLKALCERPDGGREQRLLTSAQARELAERLAAAEADE